MSKRGTKRSVEDLNEEILGDLSPDERLRLMCKAEARGKEHWVDRLIETCPWKRYRTLDAAFRMRGIVARSLAKAAVYNLHTMVLYYEFFRLHREYLLVRDLNGSAEPSRAVLERIDECAEEMQSTFATGYIQYHAYQRFATEVLEIRLETWLALHPNGVIVLQAVEEFISDERRIEAAEDWFDETINADAANASITLEEFIAEWFNALQTTWSDAITQVQKPTTS